MREAGDVCYADVFRDGTGVVEFVRKEDMTYAVRKLDNTKFRSHEVRNKGKSNTNFKMALGSCYEIERRKRKKGRVEIKLHLARVFIFVCGCVSS